MELPIRDILIACVVLGGIFIGATSFIYGAYEDSGRPMTQNFNETFNNSAVDLLNKDVSQMQDSIKSKSNIVYVDVFMVVANGVMAAVTITFDFPKIIVGLLNSFATTLHLDAWVIVTIGGVLTVLIVMVIISLVSKKDL